MNPAEFPSMPPLVSGGDDVEILEFEAVDESGAPIGTETPAASGGETPLAAGPAASGPLAATLDGVAGATGPAVAGDEPAQEPSCGECDAHRARHRRLLAEFDNYRVRSDREAEGSRSDGAAEVLAELLPGIDNLERALGSLPEETPLPVREGLELVLYQLRDSMRRQGLEEVPSLGQEFDPAVHEAMQVLDSADHPDRIVLQEMQKGYLLRGRLLRPSLVTVARNPASDSPGVAPDGSEAESWAG